MLAFNRLRIDSGNGSPAVDYRIANGFVESRTLETAATQRSTLAIEKQWQRLTPEQLTCRVMADTVLLRWLRHRMGVYRLIRACKQDSSSANNPALGKLESNRSLKTAIWGGAPQVEHELVEKLPDAELPPKGGHSPDG